MTSQVADKTSQGKTHREEACPWELHALVSFCAVSLFPHLRSPLHTPASTTLMLYPTTGPASLEPKTVD